MSPCTATLEMRPPPDHLRDFAQERRITREILEIIAELRPEHRLKVRGDVLIIPEAIPEDLRERIKRLGPYLRWAAGKEANVWGPGGPANLPGGWLPIIHPTAPARRAGNRVIRTGAMRKRGKAWRSLC